MLDVYRGRLSWRRVRVLLQALPADAAYYRSIPEMAGWTVTDHLLATVVDALGVVAHNAVIGPHADPKKLRRVKPPQPLPRPHGHAPRKKKRRATSEDLKRMFGGGAAYRPKEVSS